MPREHVAELEPEQPGALRTAAPDEPTCIIWDMSSENEYLASVGDRTNIAELATATAFTIDRMCQDVDIVIIKELPPCVQSVFCQELGRYNLTTMKWSSGA